MKRPIGLAFIAWIYIIGILITAILWGLGVIKPTWVHIVIMALNIVWIAGMLGAKKWAWFGGQILSVVLLGMVIFNALSALHLSLNQWHEEHIPGDILALMMFAQIGIFSYLRKDYVKNYFEISPKPSTDKKEIKRSFGLSVISWFNIIPSLLYCGLLIVIFVQTMKQLSGESLFKLIAFTLIGLITAVLSIIGSFKLLNTMQRSWQRGVLSLINLIFNGLLMYYVIFTITGLVL